MEKVNIMAIKMSFKTVRELDNAIAQIIVGAKNQREMIQAISVGIVSHAAGKGSGNVTRAKTLVDGLGDGVRRDSLVAWFAISGVMFNDEGEVTLKRSELTTANFDNAKGTMWWTVKKAPSPYSGYDFKDSLISQLKAAYKAASDALTDAEKAEKVHMDAAELKAFETFVKSQVGAGDMPTKPDALKIAKGSVTAVAKK